MTIAEASTKVYKDVVQEIGDRVSNKTISDYWKQIKELALVTSSVSGAALGIISALSLTPPGWVISGLTIVSVVSLNIAGRAQLDKSGKKGVPQNK
jgi:hypothetical protein